jgi:hypothetical protein
VLSAVNATIEHTTFANLSDNAIVIIEGGCGNEAGDYTEGPFSQNVTIQSNLFDNVSTIDRRGALLNINNIAAVQVTGCHPIGVCGVGGDSPYYDRPAPGAFAASSDGPTVVLSGGSLRIVRFSVPYAITVRRFKFYSPTGAAALVGVAMAVYSATFSGQNGIITPTNHPTKRLAVVGGSNGTTGGFVRGGDGWWTAPLPQTLSLPNGSYYVAHVCEDWCPILVDFLQLLLGSAAGTRHRPVREALLRSAIALCEGLCCDLPSPPRIVCHPQNARMSEP